MALNRYWFRWRTPDEGWGLGPSSPEGWIATILFAVIDGGVTIYLTTLSSLKGKEPWLPFLWAMGCLAVFIVLMLAKAEPKR